MRAEAWTPASAGATKVGSTSPRKGRALFEFGETQLHRRPGVGRDPDKKRRAMCAAAWTPASAGATKVGSTPPRKGRALFEFGETQLHRRPGVGRDPDKKRRAMCAAAWTPASAGATKVGSTPPRKGRALFEFGETQLHRRPGVGRDPDKKRRAMRAAAWTPTSAGATKVGSTSPRKSRAL